MNILCSVFVRFGSRLVPNDTKEKKKSNREFFIHLRQIFSSVWNLEKRDKRRRRRRKNHSDLPVPCLLP